MCVCTDETTISGLTAKRERIATTICTAKLNWRDGKTESARRAEAQVTYVVTNNHFEGKAGVNALQLKNMLTGQRVKAPETLLQHYPELKKIADR